MLDVRNLCFSYSSTRLMALESVSMCCSKGQWLSLIGPNGCGKSTLLSVIAGVRRQASGEVYVDGASARMRKRKEWARTVALMPQHPTLPEGMRVIDYIKLGRYPHRSTNNDLIERTIGDLDLQSFVASSITELSGRAAASSPSARFSARACCFASRRAHLGLGYRAGTGST